MHSAFWLCPLLQIYATSEERKQRNRQAQAAFRERRTEYIKQLETTIKHNEETLHSLQQSHRNAADECLMLRYKNSLLERILLEKGNQPLSLHGIACFLNKSRMLMYIGVDVQTELRLRGGSPNLPPNRLPTSQPSHGSSLAQTSPGPATHIPKLEPISVSQVHHEGSYIMQSPQHQASPSSHVSSPVATKSTAFGLQGTVSPTAADIQHQQQYKPHPYHRAQLSPQASGFRPGITSAATESIEPTPILPSRIPPTYYLSPFQKQYNQLGKSGHPASYLSYVYIPETTLLTLVVQNRNMTLVQAPWTDLIRQRAALQQTTSLSLCHVYSNGITRYQPAAMLKV